MKIAVIGSGISGMSVAYALYKAGKDVTVFEKNDRLGGHSRTIDISVNNKKIPVDTGFIVFNYRNYKHLTALFDHIGVAVEKSDMSFGVDIGEGWLQYSSKNIFRRIQNLVRPKYWKMVFDVVKFNRIAPTYLNKDTDITIRQCLDELKMGDWFRRYYLQAMGGAIWSCPIAKIEKFPAKTFIRFFQNHGLLTINNHPQWYTVSGGSREYIKLLTAQFSDKIKLNTAVQSVKRHQDGVTIITDNGQSEEFAKVIFACHADQAITMLDKPTPEENKIIGAFTYQSNKIVVHSDLNFMPSDKSCWASWVYLSDKKYDNSDMLALSYWMNNLQNYKTDTPIIITLNPTTMPKDDLVYDVHHFNHPVFTKDAINAQSEIENIQGENSTYYVGAYQRYGFHEDGIASAVAVLDKMDISIPWQNCMVADHLREKNK